MTAYDDLALAKGLPSNVEAEQFVLGSIILDAEKYPIVAGELTVGDLVLEKHRRIFRRMGDLHTRGVPIEELTVADELAKHGELGSCDGVTYIASLIDGLPRLDSVEAYVGIVKEKAMLRAAIQTFDKGIKLAVNSPASASDVIGGVSRDLLDLERRTVRHGAVGVRELIQGSGGVKPFIQPDQSSGLLTPFSGLNDITGGGFRGGELIILAGRTAMGKTALVLNITDYATTNGQPVLVFSLEMSPVSLLQRLACQRAGVDSRRHRRGLLNADERRKMSAAIGELDRLPIRFHDAQSVNILEIGAIARREKAERGLACVVVDYLQLIESHKRFENRVQEVSHHTRTLKLLASQLNVPVLVLSQLSRAPEQRPDKRPMLSDLRESGTIEQDADVVIFIHRPEVYSKDPKLKGKAELIVAKQRNGPTGIVDVGFAATLTKFFDRTEAAA